jgi:uncharacterized protein DUF4157
MRARTRLASPRPGLHEREGVGRSDGPLPGESVTRPAGAGSALLQLQRDYGNHYVQDVISRAQSPDPGPLPGSSDSRPAIAGVVGASLRRAIEGSRRGGRPLDHRTATELGAALGRDISHVRVHDDDQADRLSRSLDAAAFTIGSDIFFRARHYRPGTTAGRRLLAHELAHVAQQGTGLRSAHRYRLAPAGDPGERAADRAAEDIAVRGRAHPAAVQPQVPLIQRKAFIGRGDPLSARPVVFGDAQPRKARGLRPARKETAEPPRPDQDLKKKPGRVRRRREEDFRRGRPGGDDLPRVRSRPKPVVIPPQDSQRGTGDRNLGQVVKDNRSRYFRRLDELYLFAAGKTEDIGYVDREKVWARLPDAFLVLGESHDRTTVLDLVEATGVKNYVYEASGARPSPYLYPGKKGAEASDPEPHQLEEALPKFIVGLIGVQKTLAAAIEDIDFDTPDWKEGIRAERKTAKRYDPDKKQRKYQAELAEWSSGWEKKYQTREARGEWVKEEASGNYVGQHKPGGLWSPAPGKPYDRSRTEVKATLRVLQAIRGMARKDEPVADFYAKNSSVIDKTIAQLEAGLPIRLTRMLLKAATGKFRLDVLIQVLSDAAAQELGDLNVANVKSHQSYKPENFTGYHAQAEELRDSYMWHRIIEAKAKGYRLAGLGDSHRQRLQDVLEASDPDILVLPSEAFYHDQYYLHPDRD